jgi:hypothetical protein
MMVSGFKSLIIDGKAVFGIAFYSQRMDENAFSRKSPTVTKFCDCVTGGKYYGSRYYSIELSFSGQIVTLK